VIALAVFYVSMTGGAAMASPLSPVEGSFRRQSTEPTPKSEDYPEKQLSFHRQVSEPGVDGRGRPPTLRKMLESKVIPNIGRSASDVDLVRSLTQDAKEHDRKPPWLLIAFIVFFNIVGKVGDAVGPAMVGSYPISLLFLNASNTHCILTTTSVSFVPWLFVGVMRRFCEDPLYFYAGWKYREACLGMLRDWSPDIADGIDKAEEMFKNNLYVAVAVNPGATVCSLAGASRMPPIAFFGLNITSTAAQLLVMRYVCLQFPDRIDEVIGFIGKYMVIFLVIMVGITAAGALPMLQKKKDDKGDKKDDKDKKKD
jgi:membrane protein DedA with SNARE-associated domain